MAAAVVRVSSHGMLVVGDQRTLDFCARTGSEKPKKGRARLTKPFLYCSTSVLPSMIWSRRIVPVSKKQTNDKPGFASHLVKLEDSQTADDRGSRDERRNDFARNLLRLVLVGRGDAIVDRAQVRGRVDEGNVEVGVVVLLKVDRCQTVAGKRGRRGQGLDDLLGVGGLCKKGIQGQIEASDGRFGTRRKAASERTVFVVGDRLGIVDLDLDTLLGNKGRDFDGAEHFLEDGRVALALEAIVEGMQVGSGHNVLKVSRLNKKTERQPGLDERDKSTPDTHPRH